MSRNIKIKRTCKGSIHQILLLFEEEEKKTKVLVQEEAGSLQMVVSPKKRLTEGELEVAADAAAILMFGEEQSMSLQESSDGWVYNSDNPTDIIEDLSFLEEDSNAYDCL